MAQTLVASLTPPGVSAIAVVGVCGREAWSIVHPLFKPRKSDTALPDAPAPGLRRLGHFGTQLADEVVLLVKEVEPVLQVELQSHGGREVVRQIQAALQEQGATLGSWQEYLQRTCADSLQAAAAIALAHAPTVRTAGILLAQYQGAFRQALVELQDAWQRNDGTLAREQLGALCSFTQLGRHLTTPWRVVVAGAPNVGKSSLVNALAGYQRCIVSATPGTTRDLVSVTLALDGWPVELIDSAGLREAGEDLEALGMARAREAALGADLCLWVLDASANPVWPDFSSDRLLFAVNKMDLAAAWDVAGRDDLIGVSALDKRGLESLCTQIVRRLVPHVPADGAAVPFLPEWCERLENAKRLLDAGDRTEARKIIQGE